MPLTTQAALPAGQGNLLRAAAAAAAATPVASAASVDFDAFLRLLVAQLKNQDPLNPGDPTDYVAQLATFSGVEQAVNTNTKLDALLASVALSQADGIIGHTVTSADGTVSGEVTAIRIVSAGAVAVLEDGNEIYLGPGITVTRP